MVHAHYDHVGAALTLPWYSSPPDSRDNESGHYNNDDRERQLPDPNGRSLPDADRAMLARLRLGDPGTFTQLYEEYFSALWTFAYGFLRSRSLAQETVQDVFLKLWETRQELAVHTSIRGYLFGVVRHRALTVVRHESIVERAQNKEGLNTALVAGIAEPAESVGNQIERAEVKEVIQRAIRSLPERQRTAVVLRWHRQLNYDEVGAVLGISSQAARTLVLRAQGALRRMLEDFNGK